MNLVEDLIRLETAKKDALIRFDAGAYAENAREQACLAEAMLGLAPAQFRLDDLLTLTRLIRLNTSLVLNLHSISPALALARSGYTAAGAVLTAPSRRVSFEG